MSARREYDGLVSFGGGDWWYHNHGHFGFQMLRHLRREMPVLYVNSIGLRVPKPSEGRMFLTRVRRKLMSWRRGFQLVEPGFGVVSPIAVPGRLGTALSKVVVARQVRGAMRRMGMRRPLLWIECLPGLDAGERLPHAGLVFQRTDRYEDFPQGDRAQLWPYVERLRGEADLTLYCSTLLYEAERESVPSARYLDHGVDFEAFERAGRGELSEPAELAAIPRPRVGFIGGLDAHTFDPPLFLEVARELSELSFVLVGGSSLPEAWCGLPNVHLLGRVPYEGVPPYMAACDVLIMPWNESRWIEACNPIKLKEYLAVGRPVVSTPFAELEHYRGFVRVARGAPEFATAIRAALTEGEDAERLRSRVRGESWASRAQRVVQLLAEVGLHRAGGSA